MRVGNRKTVLYPSSRTNLVLATRLSSLSISQWSASKHDRQASEEIAAHHGAQPDVGRYNKLLIPKETLAKVRRLAGEAGENTTS